MGLLNSARLATSTPGVPGPPINLCGERKIASLYANAPSGPLPCMFISISTYGPAAAKSQNDSAPYLWSKIETLRVSEPIPVTLEAAEKLPILRGDRKSTRLNSSHVKNSYAV